MKKFPMIALEHAAIDSPDFAAGVAWAAHCLRHMVNLAHGHAGSIPPQVAMRPCCRQEVVAFAAGAADGLEDAAGVDAYHHTHAAAPAVPAGGAQ